LAKKQKQAQKAAEGGIQVIDVNRKARRDYHISDTYEAGLILLGSEVKSIRAGGMNLKESYVRVRNGEIFLVGCNISPYRHSRVDAHEPLRDRKLLLNQKEIERLGEQVQKSGLTIVPLQAYFKKGRCKLEIGLGKGKKLYDKREDIKRREETRRMERNVTRVNKRGQS